MTRTSDSDTFCQASADASQESGSASTEELLNFRKAIDLCAPIGISLIDMAGRVLFVNDYFCRLVGWTRRELISTLPPRPYWPPEEYATIAETFKKALAGEHPAEGVELTFMRKSGERFPGLLMISPYLDTTERQSGWIVSILDITRRHQAEQHLLQNNERLRLMVEVSQYRASSIQDLLDFALDKVVALTGSSIGYIYHYNEEREEFILNSWSREVMPVCSVAEPQSLYKLEKTGIWGEVVRQRCPIIVNDYHAPNPLKKGYPEGHVALKRFMSIPVFDDDRIVAVVGVGNKKLPYDDTDVEQLKLMMHGVWSYTRKLELETRLKAVRERFEFALTTGKLAIWEWVPATDHLEWSDSVDSMLGYGCGEFPRTIAAWKDSLHPDDRDQVLALLQRHMDEGTPYSIDYRIQTGNGDYVYWHDNAITFRDEQGVSLRMIGSCSDITERKQAELNLKQMQAQLIQQEKMASIGQLAAGVAHEINNPVGFIASNLSTLGKYRQRMEEYIRLLEESLLALNNGVWPEMVEKSRTSLKIRHILSDLDELMNESMEGIDRVKNIVADLKSFSRSDDRKTGLFQLNDCIRTTLNIVKPEFKYVADLVLDLDDNLPALNGNHQQMGQVVANLVVNAAHAIDGHGTITVRTRQDGNQVSLCIQDTGKGIAPEHIGRVFEPFFTTKEIGKGTGLGLSICYDIITKHGGTITVKSDTVTGTTFFIQLPLPPATTDTTSHDSV